MQLEPLPRQPENQIWTKILLQEDKNKKGSCKSPNQLDKDGILDSLNLMLETGISNWDRFVGSDEQDHLQVHTLLSQRSSSPTPTIVLHKRTDHHRYIEHLASEEGLLDFQVQRKMKMKVPRHGPHKCSPNLCNKVDVLQIGTGIEGEC